MKSSIITILLAVIVTSPLHAQQPFEREFKQLQEQRDKTVAAAIEPINRKYQASLDQLLRRATQGNDLDTALKIKQELGNLAAVSANSSTAAPGSKPANPQSKLTNEQITSFISGKTWGAANRSNYYTFHTNGTADEMSNGKRFTAKKWHVRGDGVVVLEAGAYPTFFYIESAKKGTRKFMKEDAEKADIQLLD